MQSPNLKAYVFDLASLINKRSGNNRININKNKIDVINQIYKEGKNTIIIEVFIEDFPRLNKKEILNSELKKLNLKYNKLRIKNKNKREFYVNDYSSKSNLFFKNNDFSESPDQLKIESGSGYQTRILLVSRVLKEATNERMQKLLDEINFLENIPKRFQKYFPKILKSEKSKDSKVLYEMEHFNLPTLRRLILSSMINSSEILYWTEKITKFSLEMLNYNKIDTPTDYVNKMHRTRLFRRMEELKTNSKIFLRLLKFEHIFINGVQYKNILSSVNLFDKNKVWDQVKPEFVGTMSHSDLHFSNILVNQKKDEFILIDPRGYDYCDYFYDFGKLWHSVNGKYEMISANMFDLTQLKKNHFNFSIKKEQVFQTLEEVKSYLPSILYKYSNEEKEKVIMKTEFNECIHFASLIPFLLSYDGKEEKAIAAYLTSVLLLNNFLLKYYSK